MEYQGRHEHIGGGLIRFVHRWMPEGSDPWAVVSIVHGLGDHGGRFDRMARWFVRHGILVSALDLVGHGRSFGRRGCVESYDALLNEVNHFVRLSAAKWPSLPRFVYGQSMGGNLTLNWALRFHSDVTGLIAAAPMLMQENPPSESFMRIGRQLSRWLPHFRLRASVDVGLLTRDIHSQRAYLDDKLIHRRISLRLGTSLVDSGLWALSHADQLAVPTLLVHGSNDRLTSPKASREFADANPDYVELRLWNGLRHDLHYEPEWTSVLDDIRRWLAGCTASSHRRAAA